MSNHVELISKDNKLVAFKYEVIKLGAKDPNGRRAPIGTVKYEIINADYIISSIGLTPDEIVWNQGVLETYQYLMS